MKKIYLIDDSIDRVLEIFGNIYKVLWKGKSEEGIASEIVFFGDQSKKRSGDSDLKQTNINFVNNAIKSMLRSHCRDEEQWNSDGKMYKEKKFLIENLTRNIRIDENSEIENIVKKWKGRTCIEEPVESEENNIGPLIDMILGKQEIRDEQQYDCYILLDVILLYEDIKLVSDNLPIISMGLYHALKQRKYKCYLYSSFTFDYLLIDNYKRIYNERYGEIIEVYQSKDFFSQKITSSNCLFYKLNE